MPALAAVCTTASQPALAAATSKGSEISPRTPMTPYCARWSAAERCGHAAFPGMEKAVRAGIAEDLLRRSAVDVRMGLLE